MYFVYIKRLPGIVISFSFAENNDKSKLGFRPKKIWKGDLSFPSDR